MKMILSEDFSEGDEVEIDVDAYSYQDKVFKGASVTAIANSADETAGISESVTEFEVRILIDPSSYADLLKERRQSPFRQENDCKCGYYY